MEWLMIQGTQHPRKRTALSGHRSRTGREKRWSFSTNRSSALATEKPAAVPVSARGLFVCYTGVCFQLSVRSPADIMTYKHHLMYFSYILDFILTSYTIAALAHKVSVVCCERTYQPGTQQSDSKRKIIHKAGSQRNANSGAESVE